MVAIDKHCTECGTPHAKNSRWLDQPINGEGTKAFFRFIFGFLYFVFMLLLTIAVFFPIVLTGILFLMFINWVYDRDNTTLKRYLNIRKEIEHVGNGHLSDSVDQAMALSGYAVFAILNWLLVFTIYEGVIAL